MRYIALSLLIAASAQAAPIAVATSANGASIVLTDERGPCEGDARLAVWISPDARVRVAGCYVAAKDGVLVSFLDGDRADIPVQALRKPTSL